MFMARHKKPAQLLDFMKFYQEHKDIEDWDFDENIGAYCVSDTVILAKAVTIFEKIFRELAGFNPLTLPTLPAAAMHCFRRNHLGDHKIGIVPKRGYLPPDRHSKISIAWLEWISKRFGLKIQHALSPEGEFTIRDMSKKYRVDGYCKDTGQVFEFHGCYYHS